MKEEIVSKEDLNRIYKDVEMNKISLDLQMSAAGTPFFLMSKIDNNMCEKIFGDTNYRTNLAEYYLKYFVFNSEVFHYLKSEGYLNHSLDTEYFLKSIFNLRKLYTLGINAVTMPNLQSINPRGVDSPILLVGLDSMLIFRHILQRKSGLAVEQFQNYYPESEFIEEINTYVGKYSQAVKTVETSKNHRKILDNVDALVSNILNISTQYI